MKLNRKGFTLIELLIVIVIIGILVAVLIAVINPARARNRAKDAGIEAAMSKIGLAIGGYMSAYGQYPDCTDLVASLDNATDTTAAGCDIMLKNVSVHPFMYTFDNTAGSEHYRLTSEAVGLSNKHFILDSAESGALFACPTAGETNLTGASTPCMNLTSAN